MVAKKNHSDGENKSSQVPLTELITKALKFNGNWDRDSYEEFPVVVFILRQLLVIGIKYYL